MKKRNMLLAIGGIIGTVAVGVIGIKTLGIGYKKEREGALKIPSWRRARTIHNPNYVQYIDEFDIIKDTDALGGKPAKFYSKYIDYIAPNQKSIRILAQNKVSDEQLLYAYSVLSFYLESFEGYDKTAIANSMADNDAILVMPNGSDRDGKTPDIALLGQPQYQNETANIGSKWYIENDYKYRDSTLEEIFHLVHETGIGMVDNQQADPEMAKIIEKAMRNALPKNKKDWGKKGLWGLNAKANLIEWENEEGSLEAEYIISVIDAYYGMWEAYPKPGALFGEYICKSREAVKQKDPMGYFAVNKFLPGQITSMMRVDPSFEGDFKMYFDEKMLYTHKSQYLTNVRLTGKLDSNLYGNDEDNILMGNQGKNIIDGGGGKNIVQFNGKSTEYNMTQHETYIEVEDRVHNRDGIAMLYNISILRFTDKDIMC